MTSESTPSIETVVVQPTPFCNINCSYCYLPQRDVKTVMEQQTIVTLFQKIFASGWAQSSADGHLACRRAAGAAGCLLSNRV